MSDDEAIAGWREVLELIAAVRGLDIDTPATVTYRVLAEVADAVERAAGQLAEPGDRRWLAAALAALSQQVQLSTLPPPLPPVRVS